MNNQGGFFYPFPGYQNINYNQEYYDKLVNKVDRLEKNIRILENRINKLENRENKPVTDSDPTDMYMI